MTDPVARRRHKRPRPQISCAICHRRKVKCDQQEPCEPCIRRGCAEECRFDGIPAKRGPAHLSPARQQNLDSFPNQGFANTSNMRRGNENGHEKKISSLSEPSSSDTQAQLRSVLLLNQTFSQARRNAASPHANGLPSHDWTLDSGNLRGRTHTVWLLQTFDSLLMYAGRHSLSGKQLQQDGTCAIWNSELKTPFTSVDAQENFSADSIYNELLPVQTGYNLVLRYFSTFDTVYPLVNRDTFPKNYNNMIVDIKTVPMSFVVKVLIMQALGNATFPMYDAPVPASTVSRWLGLAALFPSSILAFGELNVEIVRMFALLSLAEQVLKQDVTAAYIRSGACVRAAMALGIHRVEERPSYNYENARCLWEAILDLDLHACLAAGLPPNSPFLGTFESFGPPMESPLVPTSPSSQDLSAEAVSLILGRSLPIRQKIVTTLNGDRQLHFETVVKLSTELAKAMAPISTAAEGMPGKMQTFQHRFLSFVYGRFLAALHRPCAMMDHPAFYLSRNMTLRLSKQYLQEITAIYQGKAGIDPFASLLISQSVMFKTEALQAVMALCHELFHEDENGFGTQSASVLLGHGDEKKDAENVVRAWLDAVKVEHVSERMYLVAYMTLAHIDAIRRYEKGSVEYLEAMMEAGVRVEEQLAS